MSAIICHKKNCTGCTYQNGCEYYQSKLRKKDIKQEFRNIVWLALFAYMSLC
jgi:hypothetical protein